MRENKPLYFAAFIFICVITFEMLSVCFVSVARYTRKLLYSPAVYAETIDWALLYPFSVEFPDFDSEKNRKMFVMGGGVSSKTYYHIKDKVKQYTGKYLIGYDKIVEYSKMYEDIIFWNLAPFSEYNAVMMMPGGQFTTYTESRDTYQDAKSVISLDEFCREKGIDFFYINAPKKVCRTENKTVSGILDFSNENTDRFLDALGKSGVKYYDLRKILHDEGMNHNDAFFATDNHWKIETGLWAAKHIMSFLKEDFGWHVVPGTLESKNFNFKIYRKNFLGAYGKKVTIVRAEPDDFTLITPKNMTRIKLIVPDRGTDTEGDFSIMLNKDLLEPVDYYGKNTYGAYDMHSPVIRIENRNIHNGKKFLIVRDSFAGCVLPFLVLGIEYIDAIDLRKFTGSIRSYIETEKPDAVAVMYTCEMPGRNKAPYAAEQDKRLYDFR